MTSRPNWPAEKMMNFQEDLPSDLGHYALNHIASRSADGSIPVDNRGEGSAAVAKRGGGRENKPANFSPYRTGNDRLIPSWVVNRGGRPPRDGQVEDRRTPVNSPPPRANARPGTFPLPLNDVANVLSNRSSIIIAANLLANDRNTGTTPLRLVGVTNPVRGRVEINNYGNVVFTPDSNYTGVAGFSYTTVNGVGSRTTNQVMVNVNSPPTVPAGVNLTLVTDWSTQIPFIDVFKTSRPWVWRGPYTDITTTNLDSNGWVRSIKPPDGIPATSVPKALVFTSMANSFPGGRYVVLYDGEGSINYRSAATKNFALSRPGRHVITLNPANNSGVFIEILASDPGRKGNYIRNIRMFPEALESSYRNLGSEQNFNPNTATIFNPRWLERIAPFSTLRFVDWMRTNESKQVNWSDRPRLTDAVWSTEDGVPLEVMVALANQGTFNPWFNMPHRATDDYVSNFARYVRDNLAPDLKVYVEYTNEPWNPVFGQARWIEERARAVGLRSINWYARRSAEVINIWKNVFGTRSERVIGVLAPQAANTETGSAMLNFLRSTGNLSAVDAIAIAPYFGDYLGISAYASQVERLDLNSLFDELTQGGIIKKPDGAPVAPGGGLQRTYNWIQSYASLARANNLPLISYETGQHMVGTMGVENNEKLTNLMIAANRDPRMAGIYEEYIAKWNQLGGGLFMHYKDVYKPTKWGSWGLMEDLNDVNNPKYSSLIPMVEPKRRTA